MTTLSIVSLFPSLLNVNGDAENGDVLAARARWAGIDAMHLRIEEVGGLPVEPDVIVIGSGTDASAEVARERIAPLQDELRRWATEGVPVLGVGTGMELLGWGIEFGGGRTLEGLGIVPGRAVPRAARVSDDLVVRSKHGLLVGYENHARDYVGAEGSPLGRVVRGSGNGRDSGQEGVVMGSVIGTHLHGPVLAKHPALADAMLAAAAERRGVAYATGAQAAAADGYADRARAVILERLGIADR
ncbi:glutamine amidotransferase [Agromyces rhizosphaerae]|uniref:Lipid II isoglutaminyl synthase (glutamine-hydrolyzing) subunit GatD n=1 Tax=Agromyces rhizosphaerae TaxID=88374 RepID=A0A9W6CZT5_9MICO|nr:cobyric acid synthase [Agromyces rhizosphaerae]GLI28971.1 glutamine amidotransferase [Agromyces rhizosphaerae]